MTKPFLLSAVISLLLCSCTEERVTENPSLPALGEAAEEEVYVMPDIPVKKKPSTATAVCRLGEPELNQETFVPDNTKLCNFFSAISLAPEQFVIDNSTDTVIVGAKGTEILIPANCFRSAANAGFKGTIVLGLKECYSYSDMLAENLTTLSNGQLLTSAGMIHIEASCGGEPLILKEGYELPIRFNNDVGNNQYDLYYGSRDNREMMNWELDQLGCTEAPVVIANEKWSDNGGRRFFKEQYQFSKEELMMLQHKRWESSFSFNERGEVVGKGLTPYDDKYLQSAVGQLAGKIGSYRKYVSNRSFPSWEHKFYFRCTSADSARMEQSAENEELAKSIRLDKFRISSGAFYSRKLGWINCDVLDPVMPVLLVAGAVQKVARKVVDRARGMGAVSVPLSAADTANIDIKMFFATRKSIIQGQMFAGDALFNNVPAGRDFVIIATRCSDDGIHYAAAEGQTLENTEIKINLAFTKYSSPQEVLAEYRKLNKYLD